MAAELHLAEDALALHLLLQRLEGLVDIVVTDENLHAAFLFVRVVDGSSRASLCLPISIYVVSRSKHSGTSRT